MEVVEINTDDGIIQLIDYKAACKLKDENSKLKARVFELEMFIESNCYDMPGQASVRARKILGSNKCT